MLSYEKTFHDLVSLKTGFMLTIHKNSEKKHMYFSCGDRWHDTIIDGNGCFELHVGSKFHEIKVQNTGGISQN